MRQNPAPSNLFIPPAFQRLRWFRMSKVYGVNAKALFLYLVAAFFVANAVYFTIKGYFVQFAGFAYVWSAFQYFVAVVSLMFAKAFRDYACAEEKSDAARKKR